MSLQTRLLLARSGNQKGRLNPPRQSGKLKLKELLARRRIEQLSKCGITGHLVVGYNQADDRTFGVYHPHSCGSIFCPYCSKRKRIKVLGKYRDLLLDWAKRKRLAFATLTVRNELDIEEAVEKLNRGLKKLYRLKIFRPRVFKRVKKLFYEELREYWRNLKKLVKRRKLTVKEAKRKVELQKKLWKEFVGRWKNHPKARELELGQVLQAIWVMELTKSEKGYHPHWHGVIVGGFSKVLLTALWKYATDGESYITDVRNVKAGKEGVRKALQYVEDYLTDGFVEVGKEEELDKEELVRIEAVLHGRRKVRAWGFDLITRGNNSPKKVEWIHVFKERLRVIREKNLHKWWRFRKEARKRKRKIPYLVLEWEGGEEWFGDGKAPIFIGYMTPEGWIEIEPFHVEHKKEWELALEQIYAHGQLLEYVPIEEGYVPEYEPPIGMLG